MRKEKLRFRKYIGKPFYICVFVTEKWSRLEPFELLDILRGKYLINIKPFNKLKINIHRQEYIKLIEYYTQKTIDEIGEITDYNMKLPTIKNNCFKGCGKFLSCSAGNNHLSKNYNWWERILETELDKRYKKRSKNEKEKKN